MAAKRLTQLGTAAGAGHCRVALRTAACRRPALLGPASLSTDPMHRHVQSHRGRRCKHECPYFLVLQLLVIFIQCHIIHVASGSTHTDTHTHSVVYALLSVHACLTQPLSGPSRRSVTHTRLAIGVYVFLSFRVMLRAVTQE